MNFSQYKFSPFTQLESKNLFIKNNELSNKINYSKVI